MPGAKFKRFFTAPSFFWEKTKQTLIEKSRAEPLLCSKEVFAKISYRDRPDGLLGIARQIHLQLVDLKAKLSANPFLLIAESIEKPGNLGTILRSCDAAGVDAVIVCDPTTDIHNPNVVRSSVGTLFTLPVLEAGGEETLGIFAAAQDPNCRRHAACERELYDGQPDRTHRNCHGNRTIRPQRKLDETSRLPGTHSHEGNRRFPECSIRNHIVAL